MAEYVWLRTKRLRGWPWPESSLGRDAMFGEDGWCRGCGRALREQSGSLVLHRKDLSSTAGVWTPHWQFDVMCMDASLGREAASRFGIDLRDVAWAKPPADGVVQVVIPVVGEAWFDPDDLRQAVIERHGRDGATCGACGAWRWLPVRLERLPLGRIGRTLAGVPIARSPEWFGTGLSSTHRIIVRRDLAEQITAWSPRDFTVLPIRQAVA